MSKSAQKKLAAKAKKAEKKEQYKAAAKVESTPQQGEEEASDANDNFGALPLICSTDRPLRQFAKIKDLDESKADQTVYFRARVHNSRPKGNLCFLLLRQNHFTVQATLVKGKENSKAMLNFAANIPKESIVDVEGVVVVPKEKIEAATQKSVEISVRKLFIVSKAEQVPIQLEDVSRPKALLKAQEAEIKKIQEEIDAVQEKLKTLPESAAEEKKKLQDEEAQLVQKKGIAQKYVKVSREVRLNNRIIDLRTPANQAIFRIQSAVCQLFREYLIANDFIEIHSPKLIAGASEGGAEVFKLNYFEVSACLAQSPQLYKQMAVCSDINRVFEIGPVFRAEKSFTHRHLCEFVGLDLEMAFNEHYHEVLDVLDGLFVSLFDGLAKRWPNELEAVRQQYPFEPLKYKNPSLRLKFPEAVAMLRAEGVTIGDHDDLSTETERVLGKLVKAKYDTDFFILDKFPKSVRPFYTMPDPVDPNYSNSYDFFLRGEEIMSGSQRVHDATMLQERAKEKGIPLDSIKSYVDSFRYGALPHAGGGIGLERVVMLYLGLSNIRMSSLFPRDPRRLTP
jgi:aspartyl-tRNA synthetase